MSYPKSVTFTQARKFIAELAAELSLNSVQLPLNQAVGRLLHHDVAAVADVPAWACSRVDGFAFSLSALRQAENEALPVSDAIHAGEDASDVASSLSAHPVMTGAMIPSGADTVVMKEHATVTSINMLKLNQMVEKGAHIRQQGDDLKAGQRVLKKGRRMRPEDLGLLASVGVSQVDVNRQPKVLLLLTGDELVTPGAECEPGQVYDANSYMLRDLLIQMGCDVVAVKRLKDDKEKTCQVFAKLKTKPLDMIISVGAVSMGDKDFIPQVLSDEGRIVFHKTGIKPGFPMLFGQLGKAMYFGLPGNPVSVFATACVLARPYIKALQGMAFSPVKGFSVRAGFKLSYVAQRCEYLRVRCVDQDGGQVLDLYSNQSSGVLTSASWADGFAVVNKGKRVEAGDELEFIPFELFDL